jgi:hypothetical protein
MRAINQTYCFACVFLGLVAAFVIGAMAGDSIIGQQPTDLTCYVAR